MIGRVTNVTSTGPRRGLKKSYQARLSCVKMSSMIETVKAGERTLVDGPKAREGMASLHSPQKAATVPYSSSADNTRARRTGDWTPLSARKGIGSRGPTFC
jgi:hypothetical protein